MGVDISRIRFDPLENFAGVELKQGAVLLDADFNELSAVTDRRIRAAVTDIVGGSFVSARTPDAFHISVVSGKMAIGGGRLYVDGLLAENHGARPAKPETKLFDAVMGEAGFPGPMPYDEQPYLPSPSALPAVPGVYLIFLDVWNREVTHLEQPDLVEVAVGVETSGRVQTVWQVRVFEPDSAITCATPDDDMPGWAALIAPAAGRLTTGTFEVAPIDDPCELPPTGGYRGLENQTYRVEIHDPGPLGKATFKWSRDNASVGSRVETVESPTELTLQALGRDDVLRFNAGDWVEITDDVREMSRRCGEVRRITVIDEAARRITLSAPLPPEMLPTPQAFPDAEFPRHRNHRVRRWDHHRVLSAAADGTTPLFWDVDAHDSGVIPVPADGILLLENGVTVSFTTSIGGTGFRAGDYWVFAARTADASVELLENEPPRGILHHYTRLATVAITAAQGGAIVTDCRPHWPPASPAGGDSCACTVCVTPRDHISGAMTIQMAIDRVRAAGGGTVCLDVGNYTLPEPVTIQDVQSVKLTGQGVASRLIAREGKGAVLIDRSQDVVLDSFSIKCQGSVPQVAVRVMRSDAVRIQRLAVEAKGHAEWAAFGLSGALSNLHLRENVVAAPTGIRSDGTPGAGGVPDLMAVRIEDNDLDCGTAAISFAAVNLKPSVHRMCGNRVNGCADAGLVMNGTTTPGCGLEVRSNVFSVLGDGIRANVNGLRVLHNDILQAEGAAPREQCGIVLGPPGDKPVTDCQLVGNRIRGFYRAGLLVELPLLTAMIKQNQIARVRVGLELKSSGPLDRLSIDNNQFDEITGSAIFAKGGSDARYIACGNQIRASGQDPAVVLEFGRGDGIFSQNECYRAVASDDATADVRLRSATLIVSHNRVVGGRISLDVPLDSGPAALKRHAVVGNICGGRIIVESGADLEGPWAALNVQHAP